MATAEPTRRSCRSSSSGGSAGWTSPTRGSSPTTASTTAPCTRRSGRELHLRRHAPPLHEVGVEIPGRDERHRLLRQGRRKAGDPRGARRIPERSSSSATRSSSTRRWQSRFANNPTRGGRSGSFATTTSTIATFEQYGVALKRLIELVRALVTLKTGEEQPKVNIIAHSMGGLIVREALQVAYRRGEAAKAVNKIVTLGTPHKGIAFQRFRSLKWLPFLEAGSEIDRFNPDGQARMPPTRPASRTSPERFRSTACSPSSARITGPSAWRRLRFSTASSRSTASSG